MNYVVDNVVSQSDLTDLFEYRTTIQSFRQATLFIENTNRAELVKDFRDSLIHNEVVPQLYPEVCDSLVKYASKHYNKKFKVLQFDYLMYLDGMHFAKHQDTPNDGTLRVDNQRVLTAITLCYKSKKFEGGNLILYNDNDEKIIPPIEVGQTLFFPAKWWHELTPIISGRREVLVAWLGLQ